MSSHRPQLDFLEPEVLAQILEFVSDTSPRSLEAVASTNKYLRSVTKLIAERHVVLEHDYLGVIIDRTKELLNDKQSLANIRTITLNEWAEINSKRMNYFNQDCVEPLVQLITRIGRLQALDWNLDQNIPIEIIRALETHQKHATLRMFNWTPPSDREPHAEVVALSQCPLLTHLRAVIKSHPLTLPDTRELQFQTVIARAPNLEYAGVIKRSPVSRNWGMVGNADITPFGVPKNPNTSIRMLTLDGYDINKQMLDGLSTLIDLSSLRNVKFSRGIIDISYFQNAATMLPNLKEISLNFGHVHSIPGSTRSQLTAAAREYLTTCSPVESLSVWGWKDVLSVDELVDRHGPTLKSLQLHEKECASKICPPKILSTDELDKIVNQCPKLTNLTFDLRRSTQKLSIKEDMNFKHFEILSREGSRLSSVQIYFDAGILYLAEHPEWSARLFSPAEEYPDFDHEDGNLDNTPEPSTADFDSDPDSDSEDEDDNDNDNTGGSSSQPSTKIHKGIKPTPFPLMLQYVEDLWKKIYGSHRTGARFLTVKFGEWESVAGSQAFTPERRLVARFKVNPMERDDQLDKCVVDSMKLD